MKPRSRQTPRVRPGRDEAPADFEKRPGAGWFDSKPAGISLVVLLLAIGAALRLVYAYGLPIDLDDTLRLSEARRISLMPGAFYLPFVSPDGRHPALCVWLVAFANWIGRGNVFAIRAFFVLFHTVGLLGLFLLTRTLFGPRSALLTLALAAIDRFLATWSAQILEPGFFFLTPWILYTAFRCVHRPFRGCWAALAALSVAAFLYYELSLFLLFPVGFLLVSLPAGRRCLRTLGPYAAGAAVLAVVAIQQVWNIGHDVGTLRYAAVVAGSGNLLSFSPRVLLLYMGDLLLCLKDAPTVTLDSGMDVYLPIRVPCFWPAGVVYLACVAYSFRFWRQPNVSFLLVAVFSVALPLSFLMARDPWNNIHYAGQTVMPAIALTAWVADRAFARRVFAGRIARWLAGAFLLGMGAWLLFFLNGPKWGYFTPATEIAYCGKVIWFANRSGWGEKGMTDEDRAAIRRATEATMQARPDSLVAQYYRFRHAANDEELVDAYRQAKRIAPLSPLTALIESAFLEKSGDLVGARDCLRKAADASKNPAPDVQLRLAAAEYRIGNYAEAVRRAEVLARSRPEYSTVFRVLFFAYDALGDAAGARRALDAICYWGGKTVAEADLVVAQEFVNQKRFEKAAPYIEEALRLDPESPNSKFAMAYLLVAQGKLDRAEVLLNDVLRADPGRANARSCMEQLQEMKRTANQGNRGGKDGETRAETR